MRVKFPKMAAHLDFVVFLFFALRISLSDIAIYTIRNWDLGYFLLSTFLLHGTLGLAGSYKYLVTLVLLVCALLLGKWVGAGDLKLLMILTFFTYTYEDWLASLIRALFFAGIFAVSKLLWNRSGEGLVAMAPFLFLGFIFQVN